MPQAAFSAPYLLPSLPRVSPACVHRRPRVHVSPVCCTRLTPPRPARGSSSPSLSSPGPTGPTGPARPPGPPAPLFPPSNAPLARDFYLLLNLPVVEVASAALVLGQCAVFALQTVGFGGFVEALLFAYEKAVSSLFVVEYFLRWYSVGLKPQFLLTRTMIVDFCAVLLPMGLAMAPYSGQDQFSGLFVRALRFARVFRLQRVMDEEEMYNIFGAVPESRKRLANVFLTVFTLLYVSAGLFYDFEKDVNPEVTNMFAALYWSINTVLTVGPGDVVPITAAGRITSVCTVLIGAVLVPLQLSEIASAAMQARFESDTKDGGSADVEQGKGDGAVPVTATVGDQVAFSRDAVQPTPPSPVQPDPTTARELRQMLVPEFDFAIECPRCHLRGHQRDARFCRNCAALLTKKLYDE